MGKWSKYSKLYNKEWEKDSNFKSWILPAPGDQTKLNCKYCKCEIRCHRNDLLKHSETKKHIKNTGLYSDARDINQLHNHDGNTLPIDEHINAEELELEKYIPCQPTYDTSNNLAVMPVNKWSKYIKQYNKEWEDDDMLKSWLQPVPGNPTKASCKYCRCEIKCHRNHLVGHSKTKKHIRNATVYFTWDKNLLEIYDESTDLVGTDSMVNDAEIKMAEQFACQSLVPGQLGEDFLTAPGNRPKYVKHYKKEWENDDKLKSWIKPIYGDPTKAFCRYCKCEISCQHSNLVGHAESQNHKNKVPSARNINVYQVSAKLIVRDNMVKTAELKLAAFVACHDGVASVDHLSQVVGSVTRKNTSLDRIKCSVLIKKVLAPSMQKELIADLRDREYSLIFDESIDASLQKQLCVVIRYFSVLEDRILTTFLSVIPIHTWCPDEIRNTIKSFLESHELSLSNCVGLAIDGGSVMCEGKISVADQFKKDSPNLVVFKCTNQSIQHFSLHALKALPRIEFLISQTRNWFTENSTHQAKYNELYIKINSGKKPLIFPKASKSHWLSLAKCIHCILSQYEELKLHFQMSIEDENSYTAELLYELYSKVENQLYLVFLQPFLNELTRMDELFQSKDTAPIGMLSDLVSLYRTILQRVMQPLNLTSWNDIIDFDIADESNHLPLNAILFGNDFQSLVEELNINITITDTVKKHCQNYMFKLLKQIRARLPKNIQLFESLTSLYPSLALGNNHPQLEQLSFLPLYQGQIEVLAQQWNRIVSLQWKNVAIDRNVEQFWIEVSHHTNAAGENDLTELANFALSVLTLPFCNADSEILFSRAENGMQKAVMHVQSYFERKKFCCDTFVPSAAMIDLFTPNMCDGNEELLSADL